MKSKKILFLITGEKKAKVLKSMTYETYASSKFPVLYFLENYEGEIEIICDNAACKLFENGV